MLAQVRSKKQRSRSPGSQYPARARYRLGLQADRRRIPQVEEIRRAWAGSKGALEKLAEYPTGAWGTVARPALQMSPRGNPPRMAATPPYLACLPALWQSGQHVLVSWTARQDQ